MRKPSPFFLIYSPRTDLTIPSDPSTPKPADLRQIRRLTDRLNLRRRCRLRRPTARPSSKTVSSSNRPNKRSTVRHASDPTPRYHPESPRRSYLFVGSGLRWRDDATVTVVAGPPPISLIPWRGRQTVTVGRASSNILIPAAAVAVVSFTHGSTCPRSPMCRRLCYGCSFGAFFRHSHLRVSRRVPSV